MMRFAFAALTCAGLAVPAVHASTLQGDKFDVSYDYPNLSTTYLDAGIFSDPSPRIVVPKDPKGYGQLYPYYFHYVFGQANTFTTAPFDGVVFTDETSKDISNAFFDASTTKGITGLSASDLTFTSSSVSLNLSGVTVQAGSELTIDVRTSSVMPKMLVAMAGGVPTVPLPASAPLFGGALAIVGAIGFGLKRRAKI